MDEIKQPKMPNQEIKQPKPIAEPKPIKPAEPKPIKPISEKNQAMKLMNLPQDNDDEEVEYDVTGWNGKKIPTKMKRSEVSDYIYGTVNENIDDEDYFTIESRLYDAHEKGHISDSDFEEYLGILEKNSDKFDFDNNGEPRSNEEWDRKYGPIGSR